VRRIARPRKRSRRILRGLALFVTAFALLFIMDGSRQPTSGHDWRILGYQRAISGPAIIAPVTDEATIDAVWAKLLLPGVPRAEFDRTAVFWFTATGSFGCPSHFAGLDIDQSRRIVAARVTRAHTSRCDTLTVPDSFLIAIDRDRLPPAPYRVELVDSEASLPAPGIEVGT
jgi:hypothetical protein